MPELPEVEAARLLLERAVVGKKIEKAVVADDDKVIDGCSPEQLRLALEGRTVVSAHRKGKVFWLQLDNEGPWPVLHFGMSGGLVVRGLGVTKYKRAHLESDPDEWPPKYTKLELGLEGGGQAAFVDTRRFGRIRLCANPAAEEPVSKLGPDVLTQLPEPEAFAALLRKRVARAPALKIKALLLEQEFLSGIGNWVGDEVLYQARIHPEQSAASLDDAALAALHGAIASVVGVAVEAEADSGKFPKAWLFHYRWTNKKASKTAEGHDVEFVTVGSRTSAFVPALQKLAAGGGAKAKAGSAKGGRKRKGSDDEDGDGGAGSEEDEEEEAPKKKKPVTSTRAAPARAARGSRKQRDEEEDGDDDELGEDEESDEPPPDDDDDSDYGSKRKKQQAKGGKKGAAGKGAAAGKRGRKKAGADDD